MGNTIGYAGRYKFLDSDQDNTEIFTQNSENLIRILYDSSNNRGVEIIQKILSTFRFLEYSTDNLNCEENSKYFVISRENYGVSDFLVKSKTDSEQAISCSYIVEEDFELKDMDATYFLALTDNFLILDRGTAPPPRALIVYDLGSRKEVYTDEYSSYPPGSVSVLNDTITYWSPIDEKVTNDNCPELNEFLDTGLGVGIEAYVTLNLSDLTKEKLGEYRCSPRQ